MEWNGRNRPAKCCQSVFWWVLNSIYVVPELTAQFAIWTVPALIGIGLICGIILSLPFAIIRYVRRKPSYRAILFASIWSLVLWGREWFLTGFPWNPISNITMNMPMVINSISLWGSIGLSFIIVGLIASFIELCRNKKSGLFIFVLYVVLFLFGCAWGYHNMNLSDKENIDDYPIIRIVQPAKSVEYKMPTSKQKAYDVANQKIRDLFVWSTNNSEITPDVIVFPETAYPYIVVDDSFPLAHILNTNVIIGANHYRDEKMYNSLVVADKSGVVNHIYNKSHLVPFGEYGPFGRFVPAPADLSSGENTNLIHFQISKLLVVLPKYLLLKSYFISRIVVLIISSILHSQVTVLFTSTSIST